MMCGLFATNILYTFTTGGWVYKKNLHLLMGLGLVENNFLANRLTPSR